MNWLRHVLKACHDGLPWNRPRLSDLPLADRNRIKAMMLGAGTGAVLRPNTEGKILIECNRSDWIDEDESMRGSG